jgi:hypothetical protein
LLSRNNMNRTQYIANRKYNDVKDCHHIQEYIAYARITILNYEEQAIYCLCKNNSIELRGTSNILPM